MSIVQAEELDYRMMKSVNPTYRYAKLVQQTGGLEVKLSANGTSESVFQIPSKCMNMSKTKLQFDLEVPATALKYTFLYNAGIPIIDRISLQTRGNSYVVDYNNANVGTRATSLYTTKLSELLDADVPTCSASSSSSRDGVKDAALNRSNAQPDIDFNVNVPSGTRLVNGLGQSASIGYTEPSYVMVGNVGAAVVIPIQIPLSIFKGTFFQDKRDSYFPEIVEIRIQWSASTKIGFQADNLTPGNSGSIAGEVKIKNLFMYQCLEIDPDVCNELMKKVNSGFTMTFPYTYTYKEAYEGSVYNRQHRFTQAHGKSLLRIYNCNTHETESNQFNFDIDNGSDLVLGVGKQVKSFYTTLDNLRQTEFDLECGSVATDYLMMKPLLEGSCVQNKNIYNHNRVWCESFDGQRLCDTPDTDFIDSGRSLQGIERLYSIHQTNTETGRKKGVNYTFVVTQKTLTMQGGQIIVV